MNARTLLCLVLAGWCAFELQTDPVHMVHADQNEYCMFYVGMCVGIFGALASLLYERHRALHGVPLRERPRPTPPPLTVREVPQERCLFMATNDPNHKFPGSDDRG